MSRYAPPLRQPAAPPKLSPVSVGVFQRQGESSHPTSAGGESVDSAQEESVLQRKLGVGGAAPARKSQTALAEAPPIVHQVLSSAGQSLDPATRTVMESRFQHDFSGVRIHTDGKAAESSRAVNAVAYTVRQAIAFDTGKYAPESRAGQQLLAHELTHVVQQSRGGSRLPDARSEEAAEQAAAGFSHHRGPINFVGATAPGLARVPAPKTGVVPSAESSGETSITLNDVEVAKTSAPAAATKPIWDAKNRVLIIDVPDGALVVKVASKEADAELAKLPPGFRIDKRVTPAEPSQYQENPIKAAPTYQTIYRDQRSAPVPVKKAATPPTAPPVAPPPQVVAPPADAPAQSFDFQIGPKPPIDLNLPPSARTGKPTPEKQITEEKFDGFFRDAIAGKPSTPPPIAGTENQSVIVTIQGAVERAVKPLLKGLPKEARDFVLDKMKDAVEKGVTGAAQAAIDSAKLDDLTKSSLKKALEAALKLKPAK